MNTLNVTELHTYPRRWWAFVALSFSLLVIGLDNTVLNVALPTLARDLGATESQLQWIVDAYTLVFAGLLLTMGSLGDRFGRRKALIAHTIYECGGCGDRFVGVRRCENCNLFALPWDQAGRVQIATAPFSSTSCSERGCSPGRESTASRESAWICRSARAELGQPSRVQWTLPG